MKITWFGGTSFRIYFGGKILVVDANAAPEAINRKELLAGADISVDLQSQLQILPPLSNNWRPATQQRLIDQPVERPVTLYALNETALFVDGEEGSLILAPTENADFGPCVEGAVVILVGEDSPLAAMQSVLAKGQPRLVLLAATEPRFDSLAAIAGKTAIMAMETGLAIEA